MTKKKWWLIGVVICLVLASLSPLASSSPDGLERVAEDQGFTGLAQKPSYQVMADYVFPGVENDALAIILAGLSGTLILFGAVYGLARLLRTRKVETD